jgi:1-acyl-sn-glycerol-3-phosphate acyltransferase
MEAFKWRLLNTYHAIFTGLWSMFWMSAAVVARVVTGNSETSLRWARTKWSAGLFWACGVRTQVEGLENVDFTKPHVFVVNHQSMIDIPVMQYVLPVNIHFIAKKELLSVPFLGWYMKAAGMIPVDRKNGPEAVETLRKSALRVAGGESVIAFAEGTRSRTGVIVPFKKGAFMLALQAGVPVVPCAIEGARHALPPDGFAVRPELIRVRVGKPIATVDAHGAPIDRDTLIERAHTEVVAMNVALGGRGAEPVVVDMGATPARAGVSTVPRAS